jgi:mannose-6-phosphate isomerase-like protein (cupin superfamily)
VDVFDLDVNESTFIPLKARHRLENPGSVPLSVIEVQYGEKLAEEDIVRLDDDYKRHGIDHSEESAGS